jgi:DNA-binding transcriptional LysR family regulator
MHMDSKVVRVFVAVSERLSFSRAAADLHVAQPWLSTQIRKLESQLGFELFARTSRRVALTEEGQILLREARVVVAALDKLDLTARSLANAEMGKLRIGLPEYSHNFPIRVALVEEFSRKHPDLETEVETGWTPLLLTRLREGILDLTFAIGEHGLDGLETLRVWQSKMAFVMRADDDLARLESVPALALQGREVLAYPRSHNPALHDQLYGDLVKCGARLKILPELNREITMRHILEFGTISLSFGRPVSASMSNKVVSRPAAPGLLDLPLYLAGRREPRTRATQAFWRETERSVGASHRGAIHSDFE